MDDHYYGIGDVNSEKKGAGARYNAGKTRYDLIPISALKPAADVFEYGATKYAPNNWAKGMSWTAVIGCLMRHLSAIQMGEDIDPESGEPHVGHLLCNAIMLAHFYQHYADLDDRVPFVYDEDTPAHPSVTYQDLFDGGFDVDAALRLSDESLSPEGRVSALYAFMCWDRTPQGSEFWESVREHLERRMPLPDKASAFIAECLSVWDGVPHG